MGENKLDLDLYFLLILSLQVRQEPTQVDQPTLPSSEVRLLEINSTSFCQEHFSLFCTSDSYYFGKLQVFVEPQFG